MNAEAAPAAKSSGGLRGALSVYQQATGQSLLVWALIALLNFFTQVFLFHGLVGTQSSGKSAGEFGTLNAALGIIGLLTVPVLALRIAFQLFFARAQDTRLDRLRAESLTVIETFAWIWAGCCFALALLPLPLPFLPRFSLQLFALMNVLLALGAVVSSTICESEGRNRKWILLLVGATVTRALLAGGLTMFQPWAEAGLAAFLLAGFITLIPVLNPREIDTATRIKACATVLDCDFLLFAGATLSALLGIYLFTNADRIAALSWMDASAKDAIYPSVGTRSEFDTYEAAGLLARALLWGTQPLLWMLYAERSKLAKTTAASLRFFWIYLGALLAGMVVLGFLTQNRIAPNAQPVIGNFGPTFAAIMLPLGLLQGFAIFALASRRYPECFVIGGCSIVYALVLALFGRRPDIILPYMFGASLISIMAVLFVGVVRWGRKQP